jgi:hypothetical protein
MITLAEIVSINTDTNLCQVRVPILEPAGNKKNVLMWATMMLPPGIQGGYEKNDVVFVSFVDNSLNRPLVLGQLYRGTFGTAIDNIGSSKDKLDKATAFNCSDLVAVGKVKLPNSTEFYVSNGTELSGDSTSFSALCTEISSLKETIKKLDSEISRLNTRISSLGG